MKHSRFRKSGVTNHHSMNFSKTKNAWLPWRINKNPKHSIDLDYRIGFVDCSNKNKLENWDLKSYTNFCVEKIFTFCVCLIRYQVETYIQLTFLLLLTGPTHIIREKTRNVIRLKWSMPTDFLFFFFYKNWWRVKLTTRKK